MSTTTIANLTSGLIGSALGALFTFIAAAFTLWKTREADQAREAAREEERDEQRREAALASVLGSIRMLENEVRWAPFLKGRASAHLLEATMNFYAGQHRRHPEVADWLMTQYRHFDSSIRRWRRFWWVLGLNRRRLGNVGEQLGELNAALVLWATGALSDEDFADARRSPSDMLRQRDDARPVT